MTVAFADASGNPLTNSTAAYGDTITITASAQKAQSNGLNALADADKVFFLGDTSDALLGWPLHDHADRDVGRRTAETE